MCSPGHGSEPLRAEVAPSRSHALFSRFPLSDAAVISMGTVPTPYHVYDGYGLFIGGTAELDAVSELLRGERVSPVRTGNGRALMGIWAFDFLDASLGPHHELQFSLVRRRSQGSKWWIRVDSD